MVGLGLGNGSSTTTTTTSTTRYVIFTYGTLKKGFSNHGVMEDLISTGDALFLRNSQTSLPYPLVCGPYRVPFLLNLPGSGPHHVSGELYSVSTTALHRLDALEGTANGHYQRLPIQVDNHDHHQVLAYFAHSSYAPKMWNKLGTSGSVASYTHEVARGYVKRSDRPPNLTFLQHINAFLALNLTVNVSSFDTIH